MNLLQLRTEVLNHGFDTTLFGGTGGRIDTYLNDAVNLIARRVDYYIDEGTFAITTTAGTTNYSFPADFARARELFDTGRQIALEAVSIRDIDRSTLTAGAPAFYAIEGLSFRVYPAPDGVYPLELRYWKMPTPLALDTDVPTIPADWHHMLWVYATWICYEAEDDAQMGAYWKQRWETELAEFMADQKFPNTDGPHQVQGMWEQDKVLTPAGWALWLGY